MIDLPALSRLVVQQLALIVDPARRSSLQALLIAPRMEEREWDYGAADERYPYWVVAEAPARGIILVYCDQGFGPDMPWGYLWTDDDPEGATLGMDAQWHWSLEEAFVRSGLWAGKVREDEAWHRSPEERFTARSRPDD